MLFIWKHGWMKEACQQAHRQIVTSLCDRETVRIQSIREKHGVALTVPREMVEKSKEWAVHHNG
jgi:hypothetical protein